MPAFSKEFSRIEMRAHCGLLALYEIHVPVPRSLPVMQFKASSFSKARVNVSTATRVRDKGSRVGPTSLKLGRFGGQLNCRFFLDPDAAVLPSSRFIRIGNQDGNHDYRKLSEPRHLHGQLIDFERATASSRRQI